MCLRFFSKNIRFTTVGVSVAFVLLATGCDESKIQLPLPEEALTSVPIIKINAFPISGTVDPAMGTIDSNIHPNPSSVEVSNPIGPIGNKTYKTAEIQITGNAIDKRAGIASFSIKVIGPLGQVVFQPTVSQVADANNQVSSTLQILGVNATQPIRFPISAGQTFKIIAVAKNFANTTTILEVNYYYRERRTWFPPDGGVIGTNPDTGKSGSSREAGAFVEVIPDMKALSSPISSGTYTAAISVKNPALQQYNAILKNGLATYPASFVLGRFTTTLDHTGGVAFSADSTRGVIATHNDPTSVGQDASYFIVEMSTITGTPNVRTLSTNEHDKVPSGAGTHVYVQPTLFFSPDSTLVIVVGSRAATPIPPTGAVLAVLFDLKSSSTNPIGSRDLTLLTTFKATVGSASMGTGQSVKMIADSITTEIALP